MKPLADLQRRWMREHRKLRKFWRKQRRRYGYPNTWPVRVG